MRFPSLLALSLLILAPGASAPAQDVPLRADTAVRVGRLPNGLRYWIRHNTEPAQRLELRLVVHAGSVLEDDDQRGMAHFVEHMAFNGTERYAKNELIAYLESIGVRFGADLNASTSFDETIYILPVPSDRPELVQQAFDVLREWAGRVRFDSVDVVAERGVVLGEWRSGLGAGTRVRDKEFPLLFQGSRYADRMPIGDPAVLAEVNPAPLKRFYNDWYRPDLMAVIAVGDYPVDQLEALITSRFGDLQAPTSPRPRPVVAVPEIAGTRLSTVVDPELTNESVQLLIRRPAHGYQTEADARHSLINSLFSSIAGDRLEEVGRHADAPFTFAFFGPSTLVRDIEVFALSASAKEGRTAAAFEAVLLELRRLAAHGALPSELERSKADLLRSHERMALEAERTQSNLYVSDYIDAFIGGEVPVSAVDAYALASRLLPAITLAEVNAAIRDAARGSDRFIALRGPQKDGVVLPSREELLAILARTDTATVQPWTESVVEGPLVATAPTPGTIVREATIPEIGVTEWVLSNGIRVLIKPTDFKADEIQMSATRPGGFSQVSAEDQFQGDFGGAVVQQSGFGAFDPPALQRRLAGKVVTVRRTVNETEEGFAGNTTPADLATFFEVFWITATAPRYDSAAVDAFMERMRPMITNMEMNPAFVFGNTISRVIGRGHPRRRVMNLASFETLEARRAFAAHNARFADFSDFTFLFVGNVALDSLRPLVSRWIGGLPTSGAHPMWRDVGPPPLEGDTTVVVHKGREPVSVQLVLFNGPTNTIGLADRLAGAAAASILSTRMLSQLREAMGATYSVNATVNLAPIPKPTYTSTIQFTSTPELADSLWSATERQLAFFLERGPTPVELANFVEQQRRTTEVGVRTNAFWVQTITQRLRAGEPLGTIAEWSARLDALTADAVLFAARRYFDPARVARFVLKPENQPAP